MLPETSTATSTLVENSLTEPIWSNPLLRLGFIRVSFLLEQRMLERNPASAVLQLIRDLVEAMSFSANASGMDPQSLVELMTPLISLHVRSFSSQSSDRSVYFSSPAPSGPIVSGKRLPFLPFCSPPPPGGSSASIFLEYTSYGRLYSRLKSPGVSISKKRWV